MSDKKDTATPPEPPSMERKFQFYRAQWIGIPLLMLLPILALLNVFGERFDETISDNETLSVRVEYASRYRYKMINELEVTVQNVSTQQVPTVTVSFDTAYVNRFSTVTFHLSPTEITAEQYRIQLKDVRAGETRLVTVSLQGEHYGRHQGYVLVSSPESESLRLPISTTIFP